MFRMRNHVFVAAAAAGVLLTAAQARAVPVFVDYDVAGTGQNARAGFEFLDGRRCRSAFSKRLRPALPA